MHEVGRIDEISYIVAELVDGPKLEVTQDGNPTYSPSDSATIVSQLAAAAHHSHIQGVLHRDIKPENILMESQFPASGVGKTIPRLTDFGLARLLDQQAGNSQFGMLIGSLDYMSPEQLMGQTDRVGPQSDIYALGVILYQLLAARLPRQSDGSVFRAVEESRRIRAPRELFPLIPRDLEAICLKCLAFDSKERFASGNELHIDLENFLGHRPTNTRPLWIWERALRWANANRLVAATMVIVVLSILTTLFTSMHSSNALANRNIELATAWNASLVAQKNAESEKAKFRALSWNAGLQSAYQTFERGFFPAANRALQSLAEQHDDAGQDPGWNLLRNELDSLFQLVLVNERPLREVIAIPNSTLVAVAGDQSEILIVDISTHEFIQRIETRIPEVHALAASPDGKWLAAGGITDQKTDVARPILIDLATFATNVLNVTGETTIESLAFSPDSQHLAIGSRYEDVKIVDILDPNQIVRQFPAPRRNRSVTWLDNIRVAAQSAHGKLAAISLPGSVEEFDFPMEFDAFATMRNVGLLVATNANADGCTILASDNPNFRLQLNGPKSNSKCIATSADEQWLACGEDTGQVIVWHVPSIVERLRLNQTIAIEPVAVGTVLEGGVTSVAWIDQWLVIAGESGELALWSPTANEFSDSSESQVTNAIFVSNNQLATSNVLGMIQLESLDSNTRHPVASAWWINDDANVNESVLIDFPCLNAIENGSYQQLAVGFFDGRVDVFNMPGMSLNYRYRGPQPQNESEEQIRAVVLSDRGKWLAWGGQNNRLVVVDQVSKKEKITMDFPGDIFSISFLDSDHIAVGGQFEGTRIIDIQSGDVEVVLGTTWTGAILFDRMQNAITTGGKDGWLRSWDCETWQPKYSLRSNDSLIESISQNRDGSLGISIDEKSNVVAFSPHEQIVFGRVHENYRLRERASHTLISSQFSPDGRHVCMTLNFMLMRNKIDSVFKVYDLRPGR